MGLKEVERMNKQQSGRLGGKKKAANHRAHVENGKKGATVQKSDAGGRWQGGRLACGPSGEQIKARPCAPR